MGWLHRLFNPHCEHCLELKVCETCEVLKTELNAVRREKDKLLDEILNKNKPPVDTRDDTVPEPIIRHKSWRAERESLESKHRLTPDARKVYEAALAGEKLKANELLSDKKKEIDELEDDLGVSNG